MAVIEAEHLSKRFGRRVLAVDDVTFAIEPGTITGVLGPNGAGKTTTLRMVLDLVRPTSGRVRILGSRYRELRAPAQRVGALLDSSGFHPGRSGRNALRVIAAGAGISFDRVDEVLTLVELDDAAQRRVKGYSTGMKQRLALAAALLGDPEVLILDEPANGLDPEGMRWLRTFLRGRAAEGRTVLVSSHVLAEVEQTVDDVLILSEGRLLAQGPISALTASAQPVVRVRSPRAQELEAALGANGAAVNRLHDALAVRGPNAAQVGDLAHALGVPLHELLTEQPSLEDLFLQIAGTRRDDVVAGAGGPAALPDPAGVAALPPGAAALPRGAAAVPPGAAAPTPGQGVDQ
jgi:ABC-2 type transport system ATP-binding protein